MTDTEAMREREALHHKEERGDYRLECWHSDYHGGYVWQLSRLHKRLYRPHSSGKAGSWREVVTVGSEALKQAAAAAQRAA